MTILQSEIKVYKSQTNDNTASNGGRINDALEAVDNVVNNVWPDLTSAILSAGQDIWRKVHMRIEDDEDGSMQESGLYLGTPTSGDTRVYLRKANHVDTQGSPAFSDLYGAGILDVNVSAGANSFDVLVENGATTIFRDTEQIRISDGTNTEFHTISGSPSVASDVVTITIAGTLAFGYTAGSTYISSIIDYGTIETSYSGLVETTASGTFDEAQIDIPNIGSIYQTWTITFDSATTFTLTGDSLVGNVDTGNTSTNLAPTNPNTGTPYFTIPSTAWGGTWAALETVVFVITPAVLPVWEEQITPAGASVTAGQLLDLRLRGQVV